MKQHNVYLVMLAFIALLSVSTPSSAASRAEQLAKKPDAWFRSDEGRRTMEAILSWQTEHGDWPKNRDTTQAPFSGDRKRLSGTFDNGATTGELRALARAFRVTDHAPYRQAFMRGFDHILEAQYPHGGWPQFYPLSKGYHRHITFNDGSMVRLLEFLRDATREDDFAFLGDDCRAAAETAVRRGIDCILKCQIVVDGVPTVWCAQHHAESLAPVRARSYEHPSLSGAESAGILRFLMRLDEPTPEMVRAVKAGVAWFQTAQVEGYRYQKRAPELPALVRDRSARPLWARFYEIETQRPIFSDRDGVVKYDIEQIGRERRQGYTWYGTWGERVLEDFVKWPYRDR